MHKISTQNLQALTSLPSREEPRQLSLNERLRLIALIDGGMRSRAANSPIVADLFNDLWELVGATISGSRLYHQSPDDSRNGFRIFEIKAETGENLGYLNMLYLRKPIPCYYLAYVEIAPFFRKQGLGHRILDHYREFLTDKSAIGILDNIIPEEDPTVDIYFKHCWEPIERIIGPDFTDFQDNYMVFVPPAFQNRDLKMPLTRLVHHLKRKREFIDSRDNELMVKRAINEFKELYSTLTNYFEQELRIGKSTPLMRFMFTRFVTKLIAFRRRIGDLLGYTGGESMEQIVLDREVSALSSHPYPPLALAGYKVSIEGDAGPVRHLPDMLKEQPARFIETLPNYRRPSFMAWMKERGANLSYALTLGDLMDLGFDPTRLKEISLDGKGYIFERMQSRQSHEIKKKQDLLNRLAPLVSGLKCTGASLKTNSPLTVLRDRGNAYVLRHKIPGIHWEEALEQLHVNALLKKLNQTLRLDRLVRQTVSRAREQISQLAESEGQVESGLFAWFVSWDLKQNRPKLSIDGSGTFFESIWIA